MSVKYEAAMAHFSEILEQQEARIKRMSEGKIAGPGKKDKLIIGLCGGDGIGPYITASARLILEELLKDDIRQGNISFRDIEGLTIERRAACGKPIPTDTLAQLRECGVILKGPTTTPRKGDPWPNVESANVAMRKELDLFANVRPVRVPTQGIDWVFFRENTEGAYAVGSQGIKISEDLAVDFTVTTKGGAERIVRAAFEYAKKTGRSRVTAVTKANVIKTTDGMFLAVASQIAKEYPDISFDDWYIDIMAAKLLDEKRRRDFSVIVLPNLYGDILTDEAAELQGGVGTAGSANIGASYAMFEAIHGSAPRMVSEGRGKYADPTSMIRASVMLLEHIDRAAEAKKLENALDKCAAESRITVTGRDTGCTGDEYAQYILQTIRASSN